MDACGCDGLDWMFDRRTAEHDRDRYHSKGPDRTTRMLLDLIRSYDIEGSTILDIGGGIGIIDQELLRAGASRAVMVDASAAYLDVARDEARRADLTDRIDFMAGDFVGRATETGAADIVTLDRVVCCYPDAEALVGLSAARARTVYGLVLARDRWLTRSFLGLYNFTLRIRRKAYRAYVHPNARVDALASERGLRPRAETGTFIWRVVVYDRATPDVRNATA
jgi:magnesium-protoporphyrin O-methyltransferase